MKLPSLPLVPSTIRREALVWLVGAVGAMGPGCAQGPAEAIPPSPVTPAATPMDTIPGRRTLSTGGGWEALVREGGALAVRRVGGGDTTTPLDTEVDARVAFSADEETLYYARRGALGETDLWRVSLAGGAPELVTDWVGSEDRPTPSPDGRRLAFVSGRSGIASWWVLELDDPVPAAAARQLTNVGLESLPRRPGIAPAGFVPVPDGTTYTWTAAGLEWVAADRRYSIVVPP